MTLNIMTLSIMTLCRTKKYPMLGLLTLHNNKNSILGQIILSITLKNAILSIMTLL